MVKKKNRKDKGQKIFREGKYRFPREKEKEENIRRRKIFGPRRRRRTEREKEESSGEEKLMVTPTNRPTDQPGK